MALIGFLTFIFVGMTLVNRILEGAFITSAEVGVMNSLAIFRNMNIAGVFTIPIPNLSFFTDGIKHLVTWDYSFFGGNAALIQFFLYSLTAAAAFLLFTIIIGLVYSAFARLR
jgi:hypothetical protein